MLQHNKSKRVPSIKEVVLKSGLGPLLMINCHQTVPKYRTPSVVCKTLYNDTHRLMNQVIEIIQKEGCAHNINQEGPYHGGLGEAWFAIQKYTCEYATISMCSGYMDSENFFRKENQGITVGFPVIEGEEEGNSNGSGGRENIDKIFEMVSSGSPSSAMVILVDHALKQCTMTGKFGYKTKMVEDLKNTFEKILLVSSLKESKAVSEKNVSDIVFLQLENLECYQDVKTTSTEQSSKKMVRSSSICNEWLKIDRRIASLIHHPCLLEMMDEYFVSSSTLQQQKEHCILVTTEEEGEECKMFSLSHTYSPKSPDHALATLVVAISSSNCDEKKKRSYRHVALLDVKKRMDDGTVLHFKQENFLASFVELSKRALAKATDGGTFPEVHMTEYDCMKISNTLSFYWGRLSCCGDGDGGDCKAQDIQVGMSVKSMRHFPRDQSVVFGNPLHIIPSLNNNNDSSLEIWMKNQCNNVALSNTIPVYHQLLQQTEKKT